MADLFRPQKLQRHPKSPDARLERLRALAGSITLKYPAPSTKFLQEREEPAEEEPRPSARARD